MNDQKTLVSIAMITYNHEAYIKQAVEGVLMQECDFEYELVIADDNSPDQTHDIIQEIVNTHTKAKNIRYTRHEENKGMIRNFIWALNQCKGKYIALCEGDDYWTDPYKLKKQVNIMETDENCKICYHRVNVKENENDVSDENDITEMRFNKIFDKSNIDITDLLQLGNFMHTCSVMFRNEIKTYPFEMFKSPIGDYVLYILLLKNGGNIKKINESMAYYRRGVGVYSSLSKNATLRKIKEYQTCVLSLLENENHRKIMLVKVLKQQENFEKESIIENMPVTKLLSTIFKKVKNKLS